MRDFKQRVPHVRLEKAGPLGEIKKASASGKNWKEKLLKRDFKMRVFEMKLEKVIPFRRNLETRVPQMEL